MVELVKNYYATTSFSIITPYDSQRKLIQEKMLEEGIRQAEGRCYNVDSFQGARNL
jgi:superfamily I DNA and/or RNA helicase